ncbi:MAG: hypothetical protein A2542_00630 [Parcubacteria group bacterium RIFOXYD2_FULL_52_8]|nr:MAG: hypothetical protein A2542_00630 [Parcubacteria group bacterium RIFOXYD2_FULL_52_8]
MNQAILNLLNKERVSVLSVLLPDGRPHAAAMHYSFVVEPFRFYFQTTNTSLKAQGLQSGGGIRAAVVVGTSEVDWVTLQMHGSLCIVTDRVELEKIYNVHYVKNPQAKQYKNDPETIFLEFAPGWWRFTDFTTQPETVIEL